MIVQSRQPRSLNISNEFVCLLYIVAIVFPLAVNAEIKHRDTGVVCAVDMGSNTFKFIVAEIKNGEYIQHVDVRKTLGVGDDLKKSEKETGKKAISQQKLQQILSALKEFQEECDRKTGSRKMHAIGTAAFREAENTEAVSEVIHEQGVEFKVLSGKEESIYAYESATSGEPVFAVVDLGSRTTEFVKNVNREYEWEEIATGYKVAWDEFYEHADTFADASSRHRNRLKEIIQENQVNILRGAKELRAIEVGEAASYILGIPQKEIEGKIIHYSQIRRKLKDLSSMDRKAFADFKTNFQDAAKVLPRLVLLEFILAELDSDSFRGTDRELNVAIVYRLARPQ
jgi:exopolyphosphatase/pppGpp-phosphohydrolase